MSEDIKSKFDRLIEMHRDRLTTIYVVTDETAEFIAGARCFITFNIFTDDELREMWSHFDEMRATLNQLTTRGMRGMRA